MAVLILLTALFLPVGIGLAIVLLRRRQQPSSDVAMSVSRQHLELLQGGEISPELIETIKDRFRTLLERGDNAAIEEKLRPGEQFVVQVRALAELGTDAAGEILERQLHRQLSADHLEQTWYRIDLANGLRQLNRSESLPHLLRYVDEAGGAPLGPVFAAETFCFLGFAGYLCHPDTRLGRAALEVTRRVLEGFRICLPPQVAIEGRLGEVVEILWDQRSLSTADPALVRVFHEANRYVRRVPAALAILEEDASEAEAYRWQMTRLESLEPAIAEYLAAARFDLLKRLPMASGEELREILRALGDLRVETAPVLLPLVKTGTFPEMPLALESLRWSSDPDVGVWMRNYGRRHVDQESRMRHASLFGASRIPGHFPYEVLLRSLRGQMSASTEEFLIAAARDREACYRVAAVSSLGHWEPARDVEVIQVLEEARRDSDPDVRHAARAALARLGERSALQWFRQSLLGDTIGQQHEAIHAIAAEGLTLLWPDLDPLIESDQLEIALHAREALAVLSENMTLASGSV